MWEYNAIYSRFINNFGSKLLLVSTLVFNAGSVKAITADFVLNEMDAKEQTAFIGGIVSGLAYARFLQNRPDATGMNCVNDWFYGDKNIETWKRIDAWFSRNLDKPVEPLLYVLIKRECGE